MKLDKSKSYGTIVGHSQAMYEQNGKLFDGAGNLIKTETSTTLITEAEPVAQTNSPEEAAAVTWLTNLLKGTRVSKPNVVKEAEVQGFTGDLLTKAAQVLRVEKTTEKLVEYWKLPE